MALGFFFDQTTCIGCRTCQIACKDRHDLEPGACLRRVTSFEVGTFPQVKSYHTSVSCNHCENPACVANCPTGAMYKDAESGIVLHDDDVCIGCKTCVASCPYGAPQVAAELDDLIVKCDTCKPLREAGLNPTCVDACPMRALDFGDVDELRAKYGADLVSDVACLPSAEVTGPNLLIKAKEAAAEPGFREVSL